MLPTEKRDCFSQLQKYVNGNSYGKVCLLYGLRRTGKTTLLFQTISEMTQEERAKAVYIKARTSDSMADMNQDLRELDSLSLSYYFSRHESMSAPGRKRGPDEKR